MVRGIKKVDQFFMMAMAACNLVRMLALGPVRLEVSSCERDKPRNDLNAGRNGLEMGWLDARSACITEKRTLASEVKLCILGISAAC
jgi:hypothetical protein